MKQNRLNWLLLSAVAFSLGACSQDDEILSEVVDNKDNGKLTYSFEATIDPETRTTFDADFNLVWTVGDRLSFHTDYDYNIPSNAYDGNKSFTAALSPEATTVHVLYPYELVSEADWGSAYLTLPQIQTQEEAGVLSGANLPLYAKTELKESGNQLTFYPQAALVAFNVYSSSKTNDEVLKSITFFSDGSQMNGKMFYIFYANQLYYQDRNNFGTVKLTNPATIPQTKPTDKSGSVYMSVFMGSYSNNSFIVTTDKYTYVFTPDNTIDLSSRYKIQTINMNLANAEKYEIDDLGSHFEDANLLNCLLERYDMNKDGILSSFEVKLVKYLDCSGASAQSLKGIELFTEMTGLNCSNNELSDLNLPNELATRLTYLYCDSNHLTSLDASKYINLNTLYCDGNLLTSLNVSANKDLTSLSCRNNQLASLDISKNENLAQLYCNNNKLTALDLSNNTKLWYFVCTDNQLTSIDVSMCPNLGYLWVGGNQLTTLDISHNPNLLVIYCDHNHLTELDLSNQTKLSQLICNNNKLTSLDVSACSSGIWVECSNQDMPEGTIFQLIKAAGQTVDATLPEGAETIVK